MGVVELPGSSNTVPASIAKSQNDSTSSNRRYGHLKCDEIQVPSPGLFRFEDLIWYSGQAWIPKSRLNDFLKGEECRPKFNTTLKIRETVVRNGSLGLVTIRYWCSYGPLDARKDRIEDIPDKRVLENGELPMRQTTNTGASFRRGCQFHFSANFKEVERPGACLLRFGVFHHRDKEGGQCHGWDDITAWEFGAHIAPRISIDLRESIERLLRTGVSARGVLAAQHEELRVHRALCGEHNSGVVWSRDMAITLNDVHTVQKGINRRNNHWSSDDAMGLKLWVEANGCRVLLYQERNEVAGIPFLLVFGTEWQMHQMATLGHNKALCMDATFGTNEYEVYLASRLACLEVQSIFMPFNGFFSSCN